MTKKKGQKRMQPATDTIAVKVRDPSAFRVPDAEHKAGMTTYREPLVTQAMSLRDDPLGHMYHRGREEIRLGRAQYEAGRKWQRTYEMAGIGRVRSPSDIREHVDGGGIAHSGATDRQMQAHKALHHYALILGRQGAEQAEATPVVTAPKDEREARLRLLVGRERQMWPTPQWGPKPNEPGCLIPAEMIEPTDGAGWGEWNEGH